MHCPCGSSKSFNDCCLPFISLNRVPKTPEQLMRSRFSAYATNNAQYIFDTYATAQRNSQSVNAISQWANECTWIALIIHESCSRSDSGEAMELNESSTGIVEFSAYYVTNNTLCELRERSNFIVEKDSDRLVWRYTDGDIKISDELSTVKRNEPCPCNAYSTIRPKKTKKFKNCCGKN